MMSALFFPLMILICVEDTKRKVIPNILVLTGIFLGIIANGLDSVLGAVTGCFVMLFVIMLGIKLFDIVLIGGGDIKFMMMIGAFFGWKVVILTFAIAPFIGTVIGLLTKRGLAYAPSLSIASLIALYGEGII